MVKRAFIFANGEMKGLPAGWPGRQGGDLLIAADGGARHCRALGLRPDVVIGDFDSLGEAEVNQLQAAGAILIRHPARKDETDLELAFRHAQEAGAKEVIVFGALGARWDMTLANVLLAAQEDYAEMQVRLVDGRQEMTLLRGGQTLRLQGQRGDTVSLLPLTPRAEGITTQGLEYPLQEGTLPFGSPRGVSNTLLGEEAEVSLRGGLLLCVKFSSTDQGGVE